MAAPPEDDVLRAHGLHHAYEGSPALQGAALEAGPGEIISVTGPRGSGKTTLLGCLSGQLPVQQGEVWFGDVPVHRLDRASRERLRRDHFGWIGSQPQLVPELTAWENAALPLLLKGTRHATARRAALSWLERLDIGTCARKRPAALLQSQRQRVCVARALAHSPTVLFADEPTAPLHQADRVHVLRALTSAARSQGITVLLTTHDPAVILPGSGPGRPGTTEPALTDRTLTLVDGRTEDHGNPPVHGTKGAPGTGTDLTGTDLTGTDGEDTDDRARHDKGRDACSLSV